VVIGVYRIEGLLSEVFVKKVEGLPQEAELTLDDDLLTIEAAAKKLHLHPGSLYRHIKAETLPIPYYRLSNRKILLNPVDILNWIKTRKTPAGKRRGEI